MTNAMFNKQICFNVEGTFREFNPMSRYNH